jgi:hypothetical protein
MSNLLRNDHNVYILGAGFSREAGLPLISDFLSQMRDSYDWLVQQGREREAKAVDEVLKFRLAAASAAYWVNLDLENIEELFSLAFANTDGIAGSMRFAIAATLDYARKTKGRLRTRLQVRHDGTLFKNDKWPDWIKRSDQQPTDNNGSYQIGSYALHIARLIGMLKDGKPQGENTFITFNYDTLLEEALTELNLPITYGSRIESPFTPKAKSRTEPTPVYKLHGSVNWTRTGEESKAIKAFEHYFQITTPQLLPELVPPTWKKIFENEIETIWEEAVEKLTTATRIIIIGFSMPPTDMHFKYLLAAGLKQNISLRQVLFVNPDTGNDLKPRVENMLRQAYVDSGRISFAKATIGQFTGLQPSNGMGLHQLGRPTEYGLTYHLFDQT